MIGRGSYLPRLWTLDGKGTKWLPIGAAPDSSGTCGWTLHQVTTSQFQSRIDLFDGATDSIEPGETLLTIERNSLEIWAGFVDTVDVDAHAGVFTVTASDYLNEFSRLVVRDLLDTQRGGQYVDLHAAAVLSSAATGAYQFIDLGLRTQAGPNFVERQVSPSSPVYALDELSSLADLGLDYFAIGRVIALINRAEEIAPSAFQLDTESSWGRPPILRRTRANYANRVWAVQQSGILISPLDPPTDRALAEHIQAADKNVSNLEDFANTYRDQLSVSRTVVVPAGPLKTTAELDIQDLTPTTIGDIITPAGRMKIRVLETKFTWKDGIAGDDPDDSGVEMVLGVPLAAPYRISLIDAEATQASILANVEDRVRKLENRAVINGQVL